MTDQLELNRKTLADYLDSLPEDYKHFEMATYIDNEAYQEENDDSNYINAQFLDYALKNGGVANHGCGTVACAVGHGPAAGLLFTPEEITTISYYDYNNIGDYVTAEAPNWNRYSERFVASRGDSDWEWCFGAGWSLYDNHHWGAAARLRYLNHHGKVPEGFWGPGEDWVEVYAEFRRK
jgi:hypothetical protein